MSPIKVWHGLLAAWLDNADGTIRSWFTVTESVPHYSLFSLLLVVPSSSQIVCFIRSFTDDAYSRCAVKLVLLSCDMCCVSVCM